MGLNRTSDWGPVPRAPSSVHFANRKDTSRGGWRRRSSFLRGGEQSPQENPDARREGDTCSSCISWPGPRDHLRQTQWPETRSRSHGFPGPVPGAQRAPGLSSESHEAAVERVGRAAFGTRDPRPSSGLRPHHAAPSPGSAGASRRRAENVHVPICASCRSVEPAPAEAWDSAFPTSLWGGASGLGRCLRCSRLDFSPHVGMKRAEPQEEE